MEFGFIALKQTAIMLQFSVFGSVWNLVRNSGRSAVPCQISHWSMQRLTLNCEDVIFGTLSSCIGLLFIQFWIVVFWWIDSLLSSSLSVLYLILKCATFGSVFTARRSCASAVLGVVILFVRPSVCLSHTWFVTNPKKLPAIFLCNVHERAILLVFCHPTVVGGRRPLPPVMGDRSDQPHSKIAYVDRFPPVTSQQ